MIRFISIFDIFRQLIIVINFKKLYGICQIIIQSVIKIQPFICIQDSRSAVRFSKRINRFRFRSVGDYKLCMELD